MSRGDTRAGGRRGRRRQGRLRTWVSVLVVLTLLVAAGAAYRFDLGERWLGTDAPVPPEGPAAGPAVVPPPPSLQLPQAEPAPAVAAPRPATTSLDPALVRRAVGRLLDARALGRRVLAAVAPLAGGGPVLRRGTGSAIPASVMKLLTTTAALRVLGPDTTFRTTVVTGATAREVVLVGGGDPYLASRPPGAANGTSRTPTADVLTLARRTAAALRARGVTRVGVGYDASLFTGPAVNPTWKPTYISEQVVSPTTALWVDRGEDPDGFGRVPDPAATAAAAFAEALGEAGIRVRGAPRPTTAASGARQLAAVTGAPVEQVVRRVVSTSDNEASEVLLRHIGSVIGGTPSTTAGVAGVRTTLAGLGVPLTGVVVADGSGLSRSNRLTPDAVIAVLRLAASAQHPDLRAVVEGLPVAGFSGSLESRFTDGDPAGAGRVRAKTGTLDGVGALAGLVTGLDGAVMVFVVSLDRVRLADALDARAAIDRAVAALAGCRCAGPT